jgi:hypothetical protein
MLSSHSFLGFLGALFLEACKLCSSPKVRDPVSQPYKKSGDAMVQYDYLLIYVIALYQLNAMPSTVAQAGD